MAKKIKLNKTNHLPLIISVFAFAVAGTALLYSASAAPKAKTPSGSINVVSSSDLRYGGSVSFDTTYGNYNTHNAEVFVTVTCSQDGSIKYRYSASPSYSFPLEQQRGYAGVGVYWDTTKPAECIGSLVFWEEKGKKIFYDVIDNTEYFTVAAAQ